MSLPVAGGKRKRFSFAEKYEILQELDKGAKRTSVQEKYGVAHGMLAGFIKKREEIEASVKKPTSLYSYIKILMDIETLLHRLIMQF